MESVQLPVVENAGCDEIVELRAKLLCYGFNTDAATRRVLNEDYGIDPGFIHGTVFETELGFRVNTAVLDAFTSGKRAIKLEVRQGKMGFSWKGDFIGCAPIRQPDLLFRHRADGVLWHDIARLHGPSVLFLAPVRQCVFGVLGEECRFCTFEMNRVKQIDVESIVAIVDAVLEQAGKGCEIAIGGGTPNLRDFGAAYYGSIVKELVQRFGVRISVELMPPDPAGLQELIESGVASLIMSIEMWSDATRKELMPGKAKVSRQQYMNAWEQAVTALGRGSVSSVLIAGLDDEESVLNGASTMIDLGVVPTLIPFRPYDGCGMKTWPVTDHQCYLRCSRAVTEMLTRQGLHAAKQAGCTACGACSLEVALQEKA